jgi:hypothetical protein
MPSVVCDRIKGLVLDQSLAAGGGFPGPQYYEMKPPSPYSFEKVLIPDAQGSELAVMLFGSILPAFSTGFQQRALGSRHSPRIRCTRYRSRTPKQITPASDTA